MRYGLCGYLDTDLPIAMQICGAFDRICGLRSVEIKYDIFGGWNLPLVILRNIVDGGPKNPSAPVTRCETCGSAYSETWHFAIGNFRYSPTTETGCDLIFTETYDGEYSYVGCRFPPFSRPARYGGIVSLRTRSRSPCCIIFCGRDRDFRPVGRLPIR